VGKPEVSTTTAERRTGTPRKPAGRRGARDRSAARAQRAPAGTIERLTRLSLQGLHASHISGEAAVVQTLRGVVGHDGPALEPQGRNLRYAAIAALGLKCLDARDQTNTLHGMPAADLARGAAHQARSDADPGAVALAAWALAEVAGEIDAVLFQRLRGWLASGQPLPTVDVAWMVTAATAARNLGAVADVAERGAERLLAAQGPAGIFPHALPASSLGRLRSHVGCFADQVYPIQALARHAAATGDGTAMDAANRCATAICDVQGDAGQWWWHYDARDGSVVERFPVYSVHQHAMGPMALLDLLECGGDDHTAEVLLGLDWLRTHPETFSELVDERHGVVWRKVGRHEPRKAARRLAAVTTAVRAGWHLPGVDRLLPATAIDYECRPYELGWLLYAWYGTAGVEPLVRETPEQTTVPPGLSLVSPAARAPGKAALFGMPMDAMTLTDVVGRCDEAIRDRRPVQIGVLNAAKVVRLRSDAMLRNSLLACEVIVADGQSVVWASRVLGDPLPERVAGIDLFESLLALADRDGRRVYLLGARPEVVARVAEVVAERYPGAQVVGSRDGYFPDSDSAQVAAEIQTSGADMLFLGMVSPKKEIFVGTYGPTLGVPVVHGVGGSFDVVAGVTARAPLAWQRAGMEWAYRLKQEPRRLARRYLTTNSAFMVLTARERFRPTTPYAAPAQSGETLRRVS
jgi:exopolysaccharide biosynthesis WecB/TagA/CpsF family protein